MILCSTNGRQIKFSVDPRGVYLHVLPCELLKSIDVLHYHSEKRYLRETRRHEIPDVEPEANG